MSRRDIPHRRLDRRTTAAAAALAAVVSAATAPPLVMADTYEWTDASGTGSWNTSVSLGGGFYETNWTDETQFQFGPVLPPSSSSTVILYNTPTGGSAVESTQNIANPFLLNSLQFESLAGQYTVDGNPLQFTGTNPTIIQDSPNGENVNADLQLGATVAVNIGTLTPAANNGGLVINGNITNVNNNNAGLTIGSGMNLYLTGNNTYTGQTTVQNGGILVAESANSAQNTTVDLQGGSELDIPTVNVQVGGLAGSGVVFFAPLTYYFSGSAMEESALIGTNNQSTTFSGTFEVLNFSPPGFETLLQKMGSGTFTYTGDSSGDENVSGEGNYLNFLNINDGAVDLAGAQLLLQSPPTDLTDAVLYMYSGTALNLSNKAVLTAQGACALNGNATATINNSSMTVSNVPGVEQAYLALDDTSSLSVTNGGTLTTNVLYTAPQTTLSISDPAGGTALTINGAVDSNNTAFTESTLTGTISDGATGPGSLHITNGATVFMQAANTYSGQTLVDGSSNLYVYNALSLQNSTLNLQGSGVGTLGASTLTLGNLAGDSTGKLTFDLAGVGSSVSATFGQNNQNTTYSGGFSQTTGPSGAESELIKVGTGEFIYNGNSSAGLNSFAATAGSVVFEAGNLSLSSVGYTGFGGQSALFADSGATITIQNGFTLTTTGYASIHNNAAISLVGAGTQWSQYSTPGTTNGGILVGEAGKTSNLTVEDGAQLSAAYLQIGDPSLTSNPGYGNVTFEDGGAGNIAATATANGSEGEVFLQQGSKLTVLSSTLTSNFITAASGSTIDLTDGTNGAALTLNGGYNSTNASTISNLDGAIANYTTAGSIHLTNGAAVIMGGTGTYTGQTLVDESSELAIQNQYAVQDSTVNVQTKAYVFLAPAAVTFGGLSGDSSGIVEFNPNSGVISTVLTVGQNGQSTSFAGTFLQYGQPSGFVAGLVKAGTGTFTYTGNSGTGLTYLSTTGGTVDLSGATLSLTSTSTTGGSNSSIYIGNAATLDVTNGSKISLTAFASLQNTGTLNIQGSGTTFTQTDLSNGAGGLIAGQAGGTSTVTVSNNAVANLTYLQIGNSGNTANPGVANCTITSGAAVTVADGGGDDGQTVVDTGTLTVSDATLTTGLLWMNPGGSASLSDPTGGVALTINRAYNPTDANTVSTVYGPIADGTAGSGSINITSAALVRMSAANTYTGTTTLQNSSLLVNTGSLVSPLTAETSSTVSGTGSFGSVTLKSTAVISPGDITDYATGEATLTSLVLDDGSSYLWKINALASAGGSPGAATGWDLLSLGSLALPTDNGQTTIDVDSIANGKFGTLAGFNPAESYAWLLAESSNDPFSNLAAFTLDTSEFTSENADAALGTFSLASADNGQELLLNYSPVPEPSTLTLVGAAILLPLRQRHRARA